MSLPPLRSDQTLGIWGPVLKTFPTFSFSWLHLHLHLTDEEQVGEGDEDREATGQEKGSLGWDTSQKGKRALQGKDRGTQEG